MSFPSSDRTGILIVRLWIEGNTVDGFRARITQMLDSANGEKAMAAVTNADDVYAAVRKWVEAFVNPN